jgi:Na+/melibiose symporter-like transporter
LLGLKIVIGPIPAAMLFAGIIFAIFYPLSREKYAHVVTELNKRRIEKRLLKQERKHHNLDDEATE